MKFKRYYVVGDPRENFKNYAKSDRIYNDHPSSESIKYTIDQLSNIGYNIQYFGGIENLVNAYYLKENFPDTLFFNISDGLYQKNRKAQAAFLLEMLDVPYTGSDPTARLMSGNKYFAKSILPSSIHTPLGKLIFSQKCYIDNLTFPVVVKPNREGSSLGITQNCICHSKEELNIFLEKYLLSYNEVLIEEYIAGYELTCFLIGNKEHFYLNEVLISLYEDMNYFDDFIFGLEEKSNRKRVEIPAVDILPKKIVAEIQEKSIYIFKLLQMRDFARIDYRYNNEKGLFFLEINGNPVISNTSEIGTISRHSGRSYAEIVSNILITAEERLNHT